MYEKLYDLFAPVISMAIKQILAPLLSGLMKREPVHGAVSLAALYPIIDVELEPLTANTGTALDDAVVKAVKSVIEDLARDYNITLPNIDAD